MAEWQPTRKDIEKIAYPLVRRTCIEKMLNEGGQWREFSFIGLRNQCTRPDHIGFAREADA
jgi:hypothetical protein